MRSVSYTHLDVYKRQKMDCRKKENGYVIMSALNSDYVIDLSGAVISEERNIQLYKSNDLSLIHI